MNERLSIGQPVTWVLLCMSACFLILGGVFIVCPDWGAAIFGIPAGSADAQSYVRALGFRDVAVAVYIGALTLFSTRRALFIMLAATMLIPLGDIALIAVATRPAAPWHLALHAASALTFAAMALWVRAEAPR